MKKVCINEKMIKKNVPFIKQYIYDICSVYYRLIWMCFESSVIKCTRILP